ncbi:MAG: hypothetical protein M3N51_06630 [Actinomycetota bacterium]|nr:hypothetical protein [Actinomycetota bacterium]
MESFDAFLQRLEELLAKVESLDEPERSEVFELLDGIDALHRGALTRLTELLDDETLQHLRSSGPALAWLLDAYSIEDESVEDESVSPPGPVFVEIKRKPR